MAEADPTMKRVHELFEKSEKTLDEVGQAMGYSAAIARKAVWQFLKTGDPRLSMLRKFAKAMDVPLADLIEEKKTRPQ